MDRNEALPPGPRFDSAAARQALALVTVDVCRTEGGPTGRGHARIVFQNDGRVQSVTIFGMQFTHTPAAACIAERFFHVEVPAFGGAPYVTTISFVIADP
jgi:hypothetical protein